MKLEIIVAMDQNQVIGHQQTLPWRLAADLQHFKHLTTGHTLIMGRKTFESIGRPLPNRQNIVLSRQPITLDGVVWAENFAHALSLARQTEQKVFAIGGHAIFAWALTFAQTLHITQVHTTVTGDVWFPAWQPTAWQLRHTTEHTADQHNEYPMTFLTYDRIEPQTAPKT